MTPARFRIGLAAAALLAGTTMLGATIGGLVLLPWLGLRGTIEALPEVVAAVNGRIPVFLDGGVRRGTDVFKALALGANGVGIGRPTLWGLGAFGEAGVNRVLEILQAELKLVMGN